MLAVTLVAPNPGDPLSATRIGECDEPDAPAGWSTVTLRAASLNHHDVWNMRGVGVDPSWLPVVLGSDGAGLDEDGNEVVIYPLLATGSDETLDPARRMISDGIDGTFAQRVAVPRENLVPKPADMSWESAAALPTAWLTAYRMLFTRGTTRPGETILVQGAGGGLATALTVLGKASGLRVWVTSRDGAKRERAVAELGADAAFESGARLPERVDAVMDCVGRASWSHSIKALKPGGRLVLAGATSGADPDPQLSRIFINQIAVMGSALGSREELRRLIAFCCATGIEPVIDSVHALADARAGIERMLAGKVFGKIVLRADGG
jgi:NADPH:quinone reductase-like Zn-dependent oxidoreductase